MNVKEGMVGEGRTSYYQCQSTKEFDTARNKARFSRIWSAIRGKNYGLLSLEDVRRIVGVGEESYVGVKSVRVDRIVGGEGRCHDFNRKFQPLNGVLQRIARLWASGTRITRNFYAYKPQYQGKEDRYGFWL